MEVTLSRDVDRNSSSPEDIGVVEEGAKSGWISAMGGGLGAVEAKRAFECLRDDGTRNWRLNECLCGVID